MTSTSWCSALPSRRTRMRSVNNSAASACRGRRDNGEPPRRLNPAHRRRALELLASSPHGATKKLLEVAHGFDTDMIAGLVHSGLAAEELEVMKAGGKTVEISRIRITKVGRQAIEG